MPMLADPQKVPCPADLQITHGNLEAAAQIREFPDGCQPLLRHLPEHLVSLIH